MQSLALRPSVLGACIEITAGSTTGTTANALPGPTVAVQATERYIVVANLGSATAYLKMGASSGPDASDTTTGGGRAVLPAGSIQTFRRRSTETHAYVYALSNCTISIMDADGE